MAKNNRKLAARLLREGSGIRAENESLKQKLDEAYEILSRIYDSGLHLEELEAPVRKVLGCGT